MSLSSRLFLDLKTIHELGLAQVGNYALYKLQLSSGYLFWQTQDDHRFIDFPDDCFQISPLLNLPNPESLRTILGQEGCRALVAESDEILMGRVKLFGGDPVPLELGDRGSKAHWTELEKADSASSERDIKWTWEAARFGWATTLARAYWVTGDEKYPAFFWKTLETFLRANPPYRGPQWTSGQEVALRIVAILFCARVFAGSAHSTPERVLWLGRTIASHAGRIPPGMAYARAQNNNHVLSEAAGLYSAGLALKEHPQAQKWRELGWQGFHRGIASQIAEDGSYTQNSTNYHRLMLQLGLWVNAIRGEQSFPQKSSERLAAATYWLLNLLDEESGGVPNLGPNDGAYILSFTDRPVWDFRPVLQAAGQAFLGKALLPAGNWDEMGSWLSGNNPPEAVPERRETLGTTIRMKNSWAYLRAARFVSRPGHADQLHADLWWKGMNLAIDPGTYLYNAEPPWDNSLSRTCAHNTVTVNGADQMRRAGRFLWLDWAQARRFAHERAADGSWERISAEHDGYRHLGVLHQRSITGHLDGRWQVEDRMLYGRKPDRAREYSIRLHWLLPDWRWRMDIVDKGAKLFLDSPKGQVKLDIGFQTDQSTNQPPQILLVRAGELVYGEGDADPILGWFSPTYAYKVPALSLSFIVKSSLPAVFISEWNLPGAGG